MREFNPGQIYAYGHFLQNGPMVFQIISVTNEYVEYTYLPSSYDPYGWRVSCKDKFMSFDQFKPGELELLENYPYDGMLCEDCHAFCRQQCRRMRWI